MKASTKFLSLGMLISAGLSGCAAEVPAGSLNSISSTEDSEDWIDVGLSLNDGESEDSLNLVKAALDKFTAKLEGGVACFGDMPAVFEGEVGNPAKSLKVRKSASGCAVVLTKVSFKGDPATYVLDSGLSTVPGRSAVFVSAASSVRLSVISGLVTSQASPIQLSAEFVALETLSENAITDGAVAVAANSDAVAAPNVKVTKVDLFNGKLYVDFECSNSTSPAGACKPSLSGSQVQNQSLATMKARLIQVPARATVAETLGQLSYSALKSRYDGAANTEVSSSNVAGIKAKFNGISNLAPATGNRIVLVVAFSEAIGSTTGTGYKAFLLK